MGYSLQANRKTREGTAHPDRDAQFRCINRQVRRFQAAAQPVISVDTKKKELVGDFKAPGAQWRPKGQPERVRVHDFVIPEQGKTIPWTEGHCWRPSGKLAAWSSLTRPGVHAAWGPRWRRSSPNTPSTP